MLTGGVVELNIVLLHRLPSLGTRSLVSGTLWGRLDDVALSEEVHHWRQALRA